MSKEKQGTHEKVKVKGKKRAIIIKFCIVTIMLALAITIFELAPNYRRNYVKDKTNIVINNNNVTSNLKKDIYIDDNGTAYLSKQDVDNYFDGTITYDEKYNQIITVYGTKVASMVVGQNTVTINGVDEPMLASVIKKDDTYYLPFSELEKVYNCETNYSKKTNTFVIASLDRKMIKADASKRLSVNYVKSMFSLAQDKVAKGEKVVYIPEENEGDWVKVRTEGGRMGYVKKSSLTNFITVREQMEPVKTTLDQKVNLVWDYYYATAPNREGKKIEGLNVISPSFFELEKLGKGKIVDKADEKYIEWAKSEGYKIWPMFVNNAMMDTTTEILNDYKLRQGMIEKLIDLTLKYDLDGINLDFEPMYKKDKDAYSRLVIELAPRLREYGKTLSVDVTAPDGGEIWSECFDRNAIGKAADYIIFMAYDQIGADSKKAGTIAGYDWTKLSLDKFINREEVKAEKIILALPFYTRQWKEQDGAVTSTATIDMNKINNVVPSSAKRTWDDATKQNYVEYSQGKTTVKIWIEDEQSIKAKMGLIKDNGLAGVAFWKLGGETSGMWDMVKTELNK